MRPRSAYEPRSKRKLSAVARWTRWCAQNTRCTNIRFLSGTATLSILRSFECPHEVSRYLKARLILRSGMEWDNRNQWNVGNFSFLHCGTTGAFSQMLCSILPVVLLIFHCNIDHLVALHFWHFVASLFHQHFPRLRLDLFELAIVESYSYCKSVRQMFRDLPTVVGDGRAQPEFGTNQPQVTPSWPLLYSCALTPVSFPNCTLALNLGTTLATMWRDCGNFMPHLPCS